MTTFPGILSAWVMRLGLALGLVFAAPVHAETDAAALRALLDEFLSRADDPSMHARFWDDELIYTSSAGLRFGKAEILAGMGADTPENDTPAMRYAAEAVEVMVLEDTAVVAFRLVGWSVSRSDETPGARSSEVGSAEVGSAEVGSVGSRPAEDASAAVNRTDYFNTGTFRRKEGVWRAIAWQATRIPDPAEGDSPP